MIVYVIEVMSVIGYENHSWIDKVFDSEEKAHTYVDAKVYDQLDLRDNDADIYIIQEVELE